MALPDLDTLRRRADALGPDAVPDDLRIRFSVVVEGGDTWTLVLEGGRAAVEPGISGEVTVRLDLATAEAIAEGRLNAQRAIAADAIRIDGDLAALPGARAIAPLGALLGPDRR